MSEKFKSTVTAAVARACLVVTGFVILVPASAQNTGDIAAGERREVAAPGASGVPNSTPASVCSVGALPASAPAAKRVTQVTRAPDTSLPAAIF